MYCKNEAQKRLGAGFAARVEQGAKAAISPRQPGEDVCDALLVDEPEMPRAVERRDRRRAAPGTGTLARGPRRDQRTGSCGPAQVTSASGDFTPAGLGREPAGARHRSEDVVDRSSARKRPSRSRSETQSEPSAETSRANEGGRRVGADVPSVAHADETAIARSQVVDLASTQPGRAQFTQRSGGRTALAVSLRRAAGIGASLNHCDARPSARRVPDSASGRSCACREVPGEEAAVRAELLNPRRRRSKRRGSGALSRRLLRSCCTRVREVSGCRARWPTQSGAGDAGVGRQVLLEGLGDWCARA